MHLVEGPDFFYARKLEKERWKKKKPSTRLYSNPQAQDNKATTAAQLLETQN